MQHVLARSRPFAATLALVLISYALPVAAQLEVAKSVVASGGTAMGSANFGVSATTGQLAAGPLQGESFSALTGFWFIRGPIATGIGDVVGLRRAFALDQNYPNPFNPTTTIQFALPRESVVTLRVFDAAGRLVDELVNEVRQAGTYRESFVAAELASGIYYYRLEAGGLVQTRRLVLLK